MRIAFYAPLKAPDHPVPSGDRQMARLLMEALTRSGHEVELASRLRAFHALPDAGHYAELGVAASREAERLQKAWVRDGAPDLWFTYHPYYKAPDLVGPRLAAEAAIPYVTAEASYSERRNHGPWQGTQAATMEAVRGAAVNLCFTERDRRGLEYAAPGARLVSFAPFIEPALMPAEPYEGAPRLITVAMMRPGDKLESYRMLAEALSRLSDRLWTLTVVGGGPAEGEVRRAFETISPERIRWVGQAAPQDVPSLLSEADIYVWPGFGEAYGLAFLEAGASALPVVAQRIAGVPEAVRDGETGLLTDPNDVDAFASAIARLLDNTDLRRTMGKRGRAFVTGERSLDAAARHLKSILAEIVGG